MVTASTTNILLVVFAPHELPMDQMSRVLSVTSDRMRRHGRWSATGEAIAYGPHRAEDVVLQLIIDDGVPDRGHRQAVFSARYRYAGVACGPHPRYRTLCVVELSSTPDGR